MSSERVFILGGTGNIGIKTVQDLLKKNVDVTLYARNPAKVETSFPQANLNVVQGDFSDLTALKKGIEGHTRLFLLLVDFDRFAEIKEEIATIAYAAGVKQIVDISSESVNYGWRVSYIGALHYEAERRILDIPHRGKFVALRPSRFMSNIVAFDNPLHTGATVLDTDSAEEKVGWISTNDVGAVAALVLTEDPEKHGDAVYTMIGDVITGAERAAIFSKVLGQDIGYKQITNVERFEHMEKLQIFPFRVALDLSSGMDGADTPRITRRIDILLKRAPESFEEYVAANKDVLLKR